MSDNDGMRSILVAGGGIVALSAAIAFARALPSASVTLLRLSLDPAALADRLGATLPAVARFNASIRIDERQLVRDGIATHHLATRFSNWSATGEPWLHGFGSVGRRGGGIAFHQLWLRAHQAGKALPYDRYSTAATLAAAGKFVHPSEDNASLLSSYLYALALDPERYRGRLEDAASAAGVSFIEGEIEDVRLRADGGVERLQLDDGREVEADLFIDCSGPGAAILSALDGSFEDWSQWLPFDQLRIDSEGRDQIPSPFSEVNADETGWTMSHGRARLRLSSGELEADATVIRPGRRARPWVANVLAIGDGAVALDPLYGPNLSLAQSAILRALELLPSRACLPVETAEYNRRTAIETCRVRDFVALHYHRSGRAGPAWDKARRTPPPEALAQVIEQFETRGRIAFHEDDTFSSESWAAAMIGLGIIPRQPAATAGAAELSAIVGGMAALDRELREVERRLPAYPDYLERMRSAN